jgi:hypothetical protein
MKVEPVVTLVVSDLTPAETSVLERHGFVVKHFNNAPHHPLHTVVESEDIDRFMNIVRLHFVV